MHSDTIRKSLADLLGVRRHEDTVIVVWALIAPILFFLPFVYAMPTARLIVYVLIVIQLISRTNYLLHWHVHRPFTSNRALNTLLDLCMGATTGVTASNWRIQHVYGHHLGDEDRFRARDPGIGKGYSAGRALSFCFRSLWPSFYAPLREAYEKGARARVRSPIDYRWAFVEQCLLVALLAVLLIWRPWLGVLYALPWYVSNYLVSRYVDYLNHYGCDASGDAPLAIANNSLHAGFNAHTRNFGYHTAHHLRPDAHWTELPRLHAQIADGIPRRCLKDFGWSFTHAPLHLYLSWKGRM